MRYRLHLAGSVVCLILGVSLVQGAENESSQNAQSKDQGIKLFEEQILPVLETKCYSCHSKDAEEIEGGLELDSPSGMAHGGESGPIIITDTAAASPLIRVLRHEEDMPEMPPDEKLPEAVIHAFEQWIRLGAPDPRQNTGPSAQQQRYEERLRHWAFQPPQATAPPTVQQPDWPRGVIDSFVLSRLESQELRPVRDADRRTLVRRIFFDLIGLPPSPREVTAFVDDDSPDAWAKLVDRLLASPRFGERWGRHWLDVVRFAESSGKEFNFTYPHAWPYRDYVIEAFNKDKPYDEFLREQLAGDLMPDKEGELPLDREARHIAPSMLALGAKRHNSGGMEFRMEIVDDQIDVTCRAILGLTVACAKCHDHKFDPISAKDYYALAGIWLSTEPLYGTIKQKYSNSPTDLLPIGPEAAALHAAAETYEEQIQEATKVLDARQEELKKAEEATQEQGDSKATDQVTKLKSEIEPLEVALKKLKKNRPPRPSYAMSSRDRAKPEDAKIAIRGDFRKPGDSVPRGFLSALQIEDAPTIDPSHSGRLELAQWITSSHNPLTARVMVNRIWHHLFGRGLVETVDNLGLMGKPPSHPELLDMLALEFMREDWYLKRMVRIIVLSRTYQLSSAQNKKNQEIDSDNRFLWRSTPRRLQAEVIRDAILTVSGQLDLERPNGSPITAIGDKMLRDVDKEEMQPPSNHRSVYLPVLRDYPPELFDLFDFPSPSLVSGRRAVTNVPSQSLYLRNSEFIAEQANQAAKRLMKEVIDDGDRVDLAIQWAFARNAYEEERTVALQLVQQAVNAWSQKADKNVAAEDSRDVAAWSALFRALFATAEFRYLVDIER